MTGYHVVLFCALCSLGSSAPAQESAAAAPAATADVACAEVLAATNDQAPFTLPMDPTKMNAVYATATIKLLMDRLGDATVRTRLGISVQGQSDPAWAGEVSVASGALVLYDRQYCVEHPLNTLTDAVDNLVHQVRGH